MNLGEKSAYVKGLADGLNIDKTTAEGKVIDALLSLVSDMSGEIAELSAKIATLEEYADEIDHDLGDLEEFVYSDDDCDCDCDDCNCDDCDDCDCDCDDMMQVECPSCHEIINFDASIDFKELHCPACDAKIFPELN